MAGLSATRWRMQLFGHSYGNTLEVNKMPGGLVVLSYSRCPLRRSSMLFTDAHYPCHVRKHGIWSSFRGFSQFLQNGETREDKMVPPETSFSEVYTLRETEAPT